MDKLGKELDSNNYWNKRTRYYLSDTLDDYHNHRMQVINTLIPKQLYGTGKRIYDFGCGDAEIFFDFLRAGAIIEGADISEEMIKIARERLTGQGYSPELVRLGGIDDVDFLQENSFDAVICFRIRDSNGNSMMTITADITAMLSVAIPVRHRNSSTTRFREVGCCANLSGTLCLKRVDCWMSAARRGE